MVIEKWLVVCRWSLALILFPPCTSVPPVVQALSCHHQFPGFRTTSDQRPTTNDCLPTCCYSPAKSLSHTHSPAPADRTYARRRAKCSGSPLLHPAHDAGRLSSHTGCTDAG